MLCLQYPSEGPVFHESVSGRADEVVTLVELEAPRGYFDLMRR